MIGPDLGIAPVALDPRTRHTAIVGKDPRKTTFEMNLAAQGPDFGENIFHDVAENIRADMRHLVVKNIGRRARGDELAQDLLLAGILKARLQLAVRKGAGPARAELHVAFRIEDAGLPEFTDTFRSGVNVFTAFIKHRALARLRQNQRGKHSGRAASDHDGPLREVSVPIRMNRPVYFRFGEPDLLVLKPPDQGLLVGPDRYIEIDRIADAGFVGGVDRTGRNLQRIEIFGRNSETRGRRSHEVLPRIISRKG